MCNRHASPTNISPLAGDGGVSTTCTTPPSLSACNRTGQDVDSAMDVRVGGRQDRLDLKRGLNWYAPWTLLRSGGVENLSNRPWRVRTTASVLLM